MTWEWYRSSYVTLGKQANRGISLTFSIITIIICPIWPLSHSPIGSLNWQIQVCRYRRVFSTAQIVSFLICNIMMLPLIRAVMLRSTVSTDTGHCALQTDTLSCLSIRFIWVRVCVFYFSCWLSPSSCVAKPQTSLRQPNHRGRGGGRGGGGGRGAGHGDFRQARDMRDGQSEGKTGAHLNKMSNQNTPNRKGNPPAEKWVRAMAGI